jgi:hypothetical protein
VVIAGIAVFGTVGRKLESCVNPFKRARSLVDVFLPSRKMAAYEEEGASSRAERNADAPFVCYYISNSSSDGSAGNIID